MYSLIKFFRRKTHKIGLALSGGAAKGLAHIGVLKALKEAEVPIDILAGTSMGAMIGACFAKDGEISVVEGVALNTGLRQLAIMLDPKLSLLGKGLIRGQRVETLLRSLIGDVEFKDLKIPFAVVATDISTGQEVILSKGSVIKSVRASVSIPGIFVPATLEGRCLVDGGLTNPVPVEVLRDMGAEFVIAVNVIAEPTKSKHAGLHAEGKIVKVPNIFNTLLQSFYIMEYEVIRERMLKADIIICPDVRHIEAFDFHKGEEAIASGYEAAKEAIPKIRKLIRKR
jgi:NTE family protein